MAVNLFRGLVDLAGGIFGFVLGKFRALYRSVLVAENGNGIGNMLTLGDVSAAVFGFLQYQRRKGKEVTVGGKKVN